MVAILIQDFGRCFGVLPVALHDIFSRSRQFSHLSPNRFSPLFIQYAQAMLHKPAVLFLDEPTANLDEAGRAIVDAIVARQRAGGILVVATNEPEEVRFGDTVLLLGA